MNVRPAPSSAGSPSGTAVTTLFTNNWTDLRVAAEYAGLEPSELVDAVTAGEVRGLTSHPDHLGEWMVPLADVEAWLRRRELARAVLA